MPPIALIISTLSVCAVTSPVPFAVRKVISMLTARLTTYAGRVPSRLAASIAPSTTGIALTLRYSPITRLSSTVSTPEISRTSALMPIVSICGAKSHTYSHAAARISANAAQ